MKVLIHTFGKIKAHPDVGYEIVKESRLSWVE